MTRRQKIAIAKRMRANGRSTAYLAEHFGVAQATIYTWTGFNTPTPHGTLNGYTNHGCRCQPCRDAFAARMRDYLPAYRDSRFSGPCPTPGCTRKQSRAQGNGYCDPCSRARRAEAA